MATRKSAPKAGATKRIVVPAVSMLSGGKDDSLFTQTGRMYQRVVLLKPDGTEVAVIHDADPEVEATRIETSARILCLALISAVLSGKASSTDGQCKWVAEQWSQFAKTGIANLILRAVPEMKGRRGPKLYEAPVKDWAEIASARYTLLIGPSAEAHGIEQPSVQVAKNAEREPDVSVLSL